MDAPMALAHADDEDDDAYGDLEQWYAASLPRLRSSASFADMADAFATARPPPADNGNDDNEGNDGEEEAEADGDYAIDLDLDGPVSGDGVESTAWGPVAPSETEPSETVRSETVSPTEDREPSPPEPHDDDEEDSRFLSFVPKKLRSRSPQRCAVPVDDGAIGDVTARARCCDRCRSDLNGKLLVKCAACAFRRHLYCFAPPLRQHPALVDLAHVPRHKRRPMATLIAQWRCADCVARLGSAPSPEAPTCKQRDQLRPVTMETSPPRVHKLKPKTSPTKPIQDASSRGAGGSFDWHAFRADKLAKVIAREEGEDHDSTVRSQQLKWELAYFSPSEALLRETARFWKRHVQRHRQQRAQHAARLAKCERPSIRALHVALTPREAAEVAESNQRHQQEQEQLERALFDDAALYPFNDPRPVFQTLRWRPPPPVVESAGDIATDGGLAIELRALREAQERERMELEDDDAPTPAQAARLARRRAMLVAAEAADDPRLLGLYLAARIIERAYVRWLGTVRRRLRNARVQEQEQQERQRESEELNRMRLEEEEEMQRHRQRCVHAQRLVLRVRFQIRFVVAMVHARRRVDVKRQLVAMLADASEDRGLTSGGGGDAPDDTQGTKEQQRRQLARRRIQRFFLRRVRRYVQLKKRVMAWRIARWWKKRQYSARFRALAIHACSERRECAARAIQRAYRSFRVYKTFCALRDRHVMRRLGRFLRGWLLRRLARKERDRVAAWDALQALSGTPTDVPKDAPLAGILTALGLLLCERGDFWNAAALLERAAGQLQPREAARDARLALAYCHHQSWYASGDPFQLVQAERGFRSLLPRGDSDHDHAQDAFVLQELALVLMHRESFRASLAVLASLIERHRDDDAAGDAFPLWLLLAGTQLAQLGEHEQSAAYLSYLVDLALPAPYRERDVLALCALSYEKVPGAVATAREAWRAALRLWATDRKLAGASGQGHLHHHHAAARADAARSRVSAQRKWALLVDLAARASDAGHWLIACRALLYALERLAPSTEDKSDGEEQRAWGLLGDAFRRLGQLELYVEAMARSRGGEDVVSDEERAQWRADAETHAGRFQRELRTLSSSACVARIRAQYERREDELYLQDVADDDYDATVAW